MHSKNYKTILTVNLSNPRDQITTLINEVTIKEVIAS